MTTDSGNPGGSTPTNNSVQTEVKSTPSQNLPDFSTTKHKVKINGAESEVSYKDLVDSFQMKQVSLDKMNNSAKEMQAAKEIMKLFKENPAKAFKELGVDAQGWAREYLEQSMADQFLSPEEKERKRLLEENESYKEKEKRLKEESDRAVMEQAFSTEMQNIERSMIKALDSSGLPKNETTIKMIAQRMMDYHRAGYTNITVDEVIPDVREQFQTLLNSFYTNSTDDQLLALLGEDYTKRVVNAKTKTFKQTQNFKKVPVNTQVAKKVESKPVEKKTPDQWAKEIKEKYNPKK